MAVSRCMNVAPGAHAKDGASHQSTGGSSVHTPLPKGMFVCDTGFAVRSNLANPIVGSVTVEFIKNATT